MSYLIFDTETTGKPIDYKAPMSRVDNWPRVIQLAFNVYSESGELISAYSYLIKPDGWEVPKEKFWIDNGFTTEGNEASGIPIAQALTSFLNASIDCHTMVAHNMAFDYPILGAEMIRAKISSHNKLDRLCTMELGTDFCKLPGSYRGKYKWPNLTELHTKLFGTAFDGAHDAGSDVAACAKCFFGLKERGVIPVRPPAIATGEVINNTSVVIVEEIK